MTTLLLVRHGETYDNQSQTMQGQTQGRLNPAGIRQAQALRDQLAARHIDAFVSSDLWRARQTALILAAPHRLPVESTPLLRERDWGDFTGRFIPDLQGLPFPDNVESLPCLLERAQAFIDHIRQTHPHQVVVAVGHGIINKAIQAVHFSLQMHQVEKMKNAEVRILDI